MSDNLMWVVIALIAVIGICSLTISDNVSTNRLVNKGLVQCVVITGSGMSRNTEKIWTVPSSCPTGSSFNGN